MDTSPIRNNPQLPPVSAPTGPSRTAASHRSSADAVHSRSWQTSVPLMQRAPSALDITALRDLTMLLAKTDEGFATPIALLADKIDETDNQKLLQNFSAFRKELFTLITPEVLRLNPEYLEAYRKFLGRYRDCSLCTTVTLKNSQGESAKIDKLLICAASPVIDNAFETGWGECKVGIFLSDDLNEDFFAHVVNSIKTGSPLEEPDNLDRLVARFTAAYALDMRDVLRSCHSALWSQQIDKRAFYSLWSLGEKYQDGLLKCFCLGYPDEEIRQSQIEEFHQLQADFENVGACLAFHAGEVEITSLNEYVLQLCQKLNLKEVRISCPPGNDPKILEGLKYFRKLIMETECPLNLLLDNTQLTELVCHIDAIPSLFAASLRDNKSLRALTFSSLRIPSEEEFILLATCLQKNQNLSLLHGLSQEDAAELKNALINGPFERSAVLRF